MTVQLVNGWRTSAGQILEDADSVRREEFEIALRRWWNQNRRAAWPDAMYDAMVRDRERLSAIFDQLSAPLPSQPIPFRLAAKP